MIEYVFLDLDDTILDFKKSEYVAIGKTMSDYGVEPTEALRKRYHVINKWHWEQLELGKMTRQQVLEGRFSAFFGELGVQVDAAEVATNYMYNLAVGHDFLPGAEEATEALSKKYRLFLASNGTAYVQNRRMTDANLYRFFEIVFVSQELGYNKPAREFFESCFARIPGFDITKAVMVGDSLSSDIQGGINAGMKTVWVNPSHAEGKIKADYEIESITQLEALLETL